LRRAAAINTTPALEFAFHGGKLYAKLDHEAEDRGSATVMGLLGLLSAAPCASAASGGGGDVNASCLGMPDAVWGQIVGVRGDGYAPEPGGLPGGAVFSFWRPSHAATTIALWPEHDVWGWTNAWVAPLDVVSAHLAAASAAAPPWRLRAPRVYWTGVINSRPRERFAACAAAQPERMTADVVSWDTMRQARSLRFSFLKDSDVMLKPEAADLRRMANYRYHIYLPGNEWSSSLKRIALAGGLLLLPRGNPHETVASAALLAACGNDLLWYDHDHADGDELCASINATLHAALAEGEAAAAARAARLHACAAGVLNGASMEAAALRALHAAAEAQRAAGAPPFPLDALGTAALPLVECAAFKAAYANARRGGAVGWQVLEWFDDRCRPRDSGYLNFTAL
jgi:hypothetical protein